MCSCKLHCEPDQLRLCVTRLPRGSEDTSRTNLWWRKARNSKRNNADEDGLFQENKCKERRNILGRRHLSGTWFQQVPEEVETGRLVHTRTLSFRGLFLKTLYLNVWRGIGPSHLSVSTNLWYIYCLLVQVLWWRSRQNRKKTGNLCTKEPLTLLHGTRELSWEGEQGRARSWHVYRGLYAVWRNIPSSVESTLILLPSHLCLPESTTLFFQFFRKEN